MDIEKFDRLYPSPAHAAAAELQGRLDQRPRIKSPRVRRHRSGVIVLTSVLTTALLAIISYALIANESLDSFSKRQSRKTIPTSQIVIQQIHPVPIKPSSNESIKPTDHQSITVARKYKPSRYATRSVPPTSAYPSWIRDPLTGQALAAALIIDKRQTVELNAEQLRLMAEDRITKSAASPSPTAAPSDL